MRLVDTEREHGKTIADADAACLMSDSDSELESDAPRLVDCEGCLQDSVATIQATDSGTGTELVVARARAAGSQGVKKSELLVSLSSLWSTTNTDS